jgi:hypothetical protein
MFEDIRDDIVCKNIDNTFYVASKLTIGAIQINDRQKDTLVMFHS